ncbi:MAG TPA: ABC transporter permease [Pyrinomonadaceae bacterium]|nr:ABC transporter permease [Pyrinomonadaceae bacterium]
MKRITDTLCVFRIHLARLRREAGPFILAALVFPTAMYLFAVAVSGAEEISDEKRLRFLAGSIVFSLSMTSISWLGYLLLENRFTGRLKLFATLPLASSSYIFGVIIFALAQAALGTTTLLVVARALGVHANVSFASLGLVILLTMLCLCGLSVIIAARARSFSEGSLLTDSLGAGLVFLAPVYYSTQGMPVALSSISKWLPTSFAASGVQTALKGNFQAGTELLALALMAIATLSLSFRLMRWRED